MHQQSLAKQPQHHPKSHLERDPKKNKTRYLFFDLFLQTGLQIRAKIIRKSILGALGATCDIETSKWTSKGPSTSPLGSKWHPKESQNDPQIDPGGTGGVGGILPRFSFRSTTDNIPASWKMWYNAALLPLKHLLTTFPYVQTCGSMLGCSFKHPMPEFPNV